MTKKIQVKQGIHKVSRGNLTPIFEGRRKFARKMMSKHLGTSIHFALIFVDDNNMCDLFSSFEEPELVYFLERCKSKLLS
jgi:hypothetical protein